MKMRHVVFAVGMLVGTASFAQAPGRDRQEVRADAQQTWNDRQDLDRLQSMQRRFQQGRAMNNFRMLQELDNELSQFMQKEWSESRYKMMKSHWETQSDVRQARAEDRQVRGDYMQGPPDKAAGDMHDRRQDERKAQEDRQNTELARANLQRVSDISRELNGLYHRMDPMALNRKQQLLGDLVRLTQWQIDQDQRELHQDKHDLHEDRREQRRERFEGR